MSQTVTVYDVARLVAFSLGISVYVTPDGKIRQNGPGELIEAPKSATPSTHGHVARAEAGA